MSNLIYNGKRLLFPGRGIINFKQTESQPQPLQIQITTTSVDEEITIPHLNNYNYNYTVDYGDGTSEGTVTTYNSADTVHTYSVAGTYILTIRGTCETFYVNGSGTIRTTIDKVLNWGETGLKIINFNGCNNLTSIVTDSYNSFSNLILQGVKEAFYNCSSLTSIPSGLFDNAININTVYYLFRACSSLTSIPSGLFDNNVLIRNFGSVFNGCYNITEIPTDLFKYNTVADSFWAAFYYCSSITSIPPGLFDYCTDVTSFYYTFEGTSITSIPSGLFDNNIKVISFENCFRSCSSLTGSSGELWLNPSGSDNYTLTGPDYDSGTPNGANCYLNSTGLSDYGDIPTYWK
jgi:hypothetical protein